MFSDNYVRNYMPQMPEFKISVISQNYTCVHLSINLFAQISCYTVIQKINEIQRLRFSDQIRY